MRIIFISIVSLLFLLGCDPYTAPDRIWDPVIDYGASPIITEILPADSAIGGVNEIRIIGENFTSITGSIMLYYDNQEISYIKSGSENEIVFYRPSFFADSADIKVVIQGKYSVAKSNPYKITKAYINFGDLRDIIDNLTSLAVNTDNALYVTSEKYLYKVTNGAPPYEEIGQLKRAVRGITDMKFSPGNELYIAINNKKIYKLDVTTAQETEWTSVSEKVAYFDFADDGTMYGGSKKGFFRINTDGGSSAEGGYNSDYEINSVKIHNDHVYLAVEYTGVNSSIPDYAIWRNRINADGSLDSMEVYFDWSNAGEYVENDVTSITFDLNDNLVVGIKSIAGKGNTTDPFAIIRPYGSCGPLYFDRSILAPTADQFSWDVENRYLYVNRGITLDIDPSDDPEDRPFRLFRIDMGN